MRKLLFISILIFIISCFVFTRSFILEKSNEEKNDSVETSEQKEKVDFESTNVDFDSTYIQGDSNKINDDSNHVESNSELIETKDDLVEFNSSNIKDKEKDNSKVENHSTHVETESTFKDEIINKESTKEESNNPWDDLGITEYDYYNKPMWTWARVDYSINDYGNISATQQACIDAGNNMMDEILSYSCTSVNSYSGKYLGEMLRVKN